MQQQAVFFLPLSVFVVVFVDFWLDVADKGQEVIQDFTPVLPEVGLEDGHLLLGVLHFSAATAMGSQSRGLLGLELLLPLQAVPFSFSRAAALACFSLQFFCLWSSATSLAARFSAWSSCWMPCDRLAVAAAIPGRQRAA